MEKFIWEDKYSVGIKIIDEQHQHFFEIANEIFDLLNKKEVSGENIVTGVTNLGNYAFYHLSTEEKYFKEFNYDGAGDHVQVHDLFREKVSAFLDRIMDAKDNPEAIADEMAGFSENWLAHHILDTDRKYIQCFKDHGLS